MQNRTLATLMAASAFFIFGLTTAGATPAAASVAKDPGAKLAQLADRYYDSWADLYPIDALEATGEAKYEDKFTITIAPANRAKADALYRRVLKELAAIPEAKLKDSDRVTYAILKNEVGMRLAELSYPDYLQPIDQFGGVPVQVAQYGNGLSAQPMKTVANYEHYLKRLEGLPAWVDQAIANMRAGIKQGVTQPRPLIERVLPAIEPLTLDDLDKNVFTLALRSFPESFTPQDRERLSAAYRASTTSRLAPAMKKLRAFLKDEYLPACRTTAGIGALPKGAKLYETQVRFYTTTNMTPDEIHELGLKEVARIRGEMQKVRMAYKFDGTLNEFLKWIGEQPSTKPFKTEQEIVDAFRQLNQKVMTKLPDLFGRMPKAPLDIRVEPELTKATASPHYSGPSADGTRPGIFWAVIDDPTQYRATFVTALFLHEGQPGHHFHAALQSELPLPKFRKFGWSDAYGEGWALYAESLGNEMGVYDKPIDYLGRLGAELHRAIRLVTDTGLHAKGWTREQTMQYMMDTEGSGEGGARRATERYMAWPGQALAYKIGELKIIELRERARQKLGERFRLKDFHDLVLKDGAMPLSLLEKRVDAWIAAQAK